MKKTLLLFIIVLCGFSCKKKSVDPIVTKTNLEILAGTTSKKWKVTDGIVINSGAEINLVASQPPCITDNILVLYPNKTYELLEGASKCDPAKDPDLIVKSTWSLIEEPKSITLDKFIFLGRIIDNPKFEILEISDSKFKGKTTIKYNNSDYLATITFSAVI